MGPERISKISLSHKAAKVFEGLYNMKFQQQKVKNDPNMLKMAKKG